MKLNSWHHFVMNSCTRGRGGDRYYWDLELINRGQRGDRYYWDLELINQTWGSEIKEIYYKTHWITTEHNAKNGRRRHWRPTVAHPSAGLMLNCRIHCLTHVLQQVRRNTSFTVVHPFKLGDAIWFTLSGGHGHFSYYINLSTHIFDLGYVETFHGFTEFLYLATM